MKALILKIGAFLFMLFAFWKWGATAAKLKTAIKEKNEVIKSKRVSNEIKSKPFVDRPCNGMRNKKK